MSQHKSLNKDLVLGSVFLILGVIWAVVIFGFSSQEAEQSASLSAEVTEVIVDTFEVETEPSIVEHFVRKSAHFGEYTLFGGLMFAAFAFFLRYFRRTPYAAIIPSIIISLLYASSDEYHQGFVAGRSPEVTDVMIDTSGAALAGVLICLVMLIVSHIKKKNTQS